MKTILSIVALCFLTACASVRSTLSPEEALAGITTQEFLTYLGDLSSDEMRGRVTGSPEYDSAARYVASKVRKIGLLPAGDDGTFFQSVPLRYATHAGEPPSFVINGDELDFEKDFGMKPSRVAEQMQVDAPVVFVGLGLSAPEVGYDDYAGLDVTGKFVMFIEDNPAGLASLEKTVLGSSRAKIATARKKGAAGVIAVAPQRMLEPITKWSLVRRRFSRFSYGAIDPAISEPFAAVQINYLKASQLMKSIGKDYATIHEQLVAGSPQSFDFNFEASVKATSNHRDTQSPNVAAMLPGSDPQLKEEVVVLSAHLDHVGVGNPVRGDSIYNGTVDNASGSSAILTIANTLSKMAPPKRSVLFLWVTGEERGLIGSRYWAKNPTIEPDRIVANQNIDMMNGLFMGAADIVAYGYEHSNLAEAVDVGSEKLSFTVMEDPSPEQNFFVRSDQYSFVQQGIPAIWIWSRQEDDQGRFEAWWGKNYHRPSDDMENTLSEEGILQELGANFLMTHHIANEMESIEWNEESFLYQHYANDAPVQFVATDGGIDEE